MLTPPPRRVAIAAYPKLSESLLIVEAIQKWLQEHGLEAICGRIDDPTLRAEVQAGKVDFFVIAGGDGSMLRSAHLCAPLAIPILGINLGRLGFLMQVRQNEWPEAFEKLLAGDYWIEERMMLRAEHWREGIAQGNWHALNEAVVCRGTTIRPIQIMASADGHLLTTYVADGLIASTATGSTAYALASGGPILPPELRNILLVPIAPHLSVDRAVVLAEGSTVSLVVRDGEAVLSVDGQAPLPLQVGDEVKIRAGDYAARFVRFGDPGYFYRNLTAYMNQNPSTGVSR